MPTPTIQELRAAVETAISESERLRAMQWLVELLLYNNPQEVLAMADEYFVLTEQLQNELAMSIALRQIGRAHGDLDDYQQAFDHLERSQTISERIGALASVADVTMDMGNVYLRLSDHAHALEQYQAALKLQEELGNRVSIATATMNIGNIYLSLRDYSRALEYYLSAYALYKEPGNYDSRRSMAEVTGNIGSAYCSLGNYAKALEMFQVSLALSEEIGLRRGVISVTMNMATIYVELGDYEKALELNTSALELNGELGSRSIIADITANNGLLYERIGDFNRALEQYTLALALFEELGDRHGVANVTENMGGPYFHLGEYSRALEQAQSSYALYADLGISLGVAMTMGDMGHIFAVQTFEGYDPVRAEEHLLRAIALTAEHGDKSHLQQMHRWIAELYQQQGKWEQAHYHAIRSHELKEEIFSLEAHKKLQQFEHLKQIAEMEKQRAIDQAEAKAEKLRAQLLESQLEQKQQKLASTAISLARQSELLRDFRKDLRGLMQNSSDMGQVIRELQRRVKELPEETVDWTKFEEEFQQSYPEFQAKLSERYPELTEMEVKVCTLLKLKLTSLDIGQLLCKSERTVEWHRSKVRAKMGLKQGEDIYDALAEI